MAGLANPNALQHNPNVLQNPQAPAAVVGAPQVLNPNAAAAIGAAAGTGINNKVDPANALLSVVRMPVMKEQKMSFDVPIPGIEAMMASPEPGQQAIGIELEILRLGDMVKDAKGTPGEFSDPISKANQRIAELRKARADLDTKNGSPIPGLTDVAQSIAKVLKQPIPADASPIDYLNSVFNEGMRNPQNFLAQLQSIPGLSPQHKGELANAMKAHTDLMKKQGKENVRRKSILTLLAALAGALAMIWKTKGDLSQQVPQGMPA